MRIGSLCAVEVEGLKRPPTTQVGGRSLSLGFRVTGYRAPKGSYGTFTAPRHLAQRHGIVKYSFGGVG